jgi:hypothetical protein
MTPREVERVAIDQARVVQYRYCAHSAVLQVASGGDAMAGEEWRWSTRRGFDTPSVEVDWAGSGGY